MKLYIILSAFVFLFEWFSSKPSIDELFTETIHLKTNRIEIKSDDIALPIVRVFAVDKYLVLQAIFHKKHLYVYDLETAELVNELYFVGRGHNEMTRMSSAYPYKNGLFMYADKSIIINDSIYDRCEPFSTKTKMPDNVKGSMIIAPINDDASVAIGIFPDTDKQFALLNDKFEVVNYFDEYPETSGTFTSSDLAMGFQGRITTSKNGFVYTSNVGNIMKFFKYNKSDVSKIKEYLFEIPKFTSVSTKTVTGVAQDRSNVVGSISVTASDNEYFMLFNDKLLGDKQRKSNTIYCFNLDGSPNKKITLDREVEHIFYSKKLKKLYAVGSEDDLPYIYEIVL